MGRKMDILLGRTLSSKLKPLLALALAHLAALKNQHQVRCSLARSDVAQLLRIGHHDRALLRVEHMIKDQNMFDVFVIIEGNCHILMERAILFEYQKDCPNELKDAISSLIFAASRCGECPELHEIRRVLTTRYGNEFAAAAVEFPKNCGVNLKMIEKMSNKSPSLESKLMVVKEIATENGIIEDLNLSQNQVHPKKPKSGSIGESKKNYVTATKKEDAYKWNKLDLEEQSSASIPTRVHIDVASADQTDSQDRGLNHLSNVIPRRRNGIESEKRDDRLSKLGAEFEKTYARKSKDMSTELCEGGSGCEKFHSACEEAPVRQKHNCTEEHISQNQARSERSRSVTVSSSETIEVALKEKKMTGKVKAFDGGDEESEKEEERIPSKRSNLNFEGRSTLLKEENKYHVSISKQLNYKEAGHMFEQNRQHDASSDENGSSKINCLNQRRNQESSNTPPLDSFHEEYDNLELGSQNKDNHVMSCTERRYELGTPHLNSEDQHDASSDENGSSKINCSNQRRNQESSNTPPLDSFHEEYDNLELGSQNKDNHVMSCTERRYELGTPHLNSEDQHSAQHSNTEKKPASVRTRRALKQ